MTPHELWVLEAVVEIQYPLHALLSPEAEQAWNMKTPKWTQDKALDALASVFFRREAQVHWLELPKEEYSPTFYPTTAQLRSILNAPHDPYRMACYGLTPQGAAVWEAAALPQWDKFLNDAWQDDEVIITGPSKDLVCEYVRRQNQFFDCDILIEAGQWQEIRPWPATYWKTLAAGYQLTARFEARPRAEWTRETLDAFRAQAIEFRNWSKWHLSWDEAQP